MSGATYIAVDGEPYCNRCNFKLGETRVARIEAAEEAGISIRCMDSMPSQQAAVDFLRGLGLNAELREGVCPRDELETEPFYRGPTGATP